MKAAISVVDTLRRLDLIMVLAAVEGAILYFLNAPPLFRF